MKKIYSLLILLLGMLPFVAFAQEVPVTHFMYMNPFRLYTDISAPTPYNGYVTLPVIGNLNVGLTNSSIRYNKMFRTDEEGYPVRFTADAFLDGLNKKNNYLNVDLNEEIFGFGFRANKKFFITVDYRLRANVDLSYSKDLFGFPLRGKMNYLGADNPADIRLGINANLYQELSLGLQHQLSESITWGARAKLLFGLANVRTRNLNASITTSPDDYSLLLKYGADAQLSAIVPLMLDLNGGSYEFGIGNIDGSVIKSAFKNVGAAIDLGFRIKPIKNLSLSATVLDLGFIKWKTSAYQIESAMANNGSHYDNGGFLFSGLSEDEIMTLTSENGMNEIMDTLAGYFPLNANAINSYATMTNTRLMLQCDYDLNKSNRVSAMVQGTVINKTLRPALTVAYNGHFFQVFDICLAYTLQKNSYDNLAVGLGFDLGPINIYAAVNNVLPAFDYTRISKASAMLGVVINWGHFKNAKAAKMAQSSQE